MFLLQPLSNLSHRLGGEGDILLRSLEKGRMREMGCSGGVAGMVEGRDEKNWAGILGEDLGETE